MALAPTAAPDPPTVATVVDLFEAAVAADPHKPILRCKVDGQWQTTTFAAWRELSARWARGLVALGLQPGEVVGIVSTTRREWVWADMAILLAGGVTVPIYPSNLADDAAYVAQHSSMRFAFVEDPGQLRKLLAKREELPNLERVVLWDDVQRPADPGARASPPVQLADLGELPGGWVLRTAELESLAASVEPSELSDRRARLDPESPCTVVYTSGTTGRPKGAVLSHRALVFEVQACLSALDVYPEDTLLLFLPLAHSFAKVVYIVCVGMRTQIAMPESMATLVRDLPEAAPTVMPSVPRVFEKVHTRILAGVHAAGPVRRAVFQAALQIGHRVARLHLNGKQPDALLALQHRIAQRTVFHKIQQVFGGRIRAFISGGAPLSRELAEFFFAVGMPVYEGYGMTENCAAATANRPGACRIGTVGRPIAGVEIAIAADGEVLVRGGNLMSGYLHAPEATAEALDGDGWLHTGDIGEVDGDGFLRITDRKKDLIITAAGKNIAPQNVESHFKGSRYISNCMVYGDRRKFLSMLVTLDEDTVRAWAQTHGIAAGEFAELVRTPDVFRLVQREIDLRNRALASFETVKKFAVLEREFTIEDGDLTPSMKLRRREVTRKHQSLLDSFYTEHY
ncbi:MAG: long-chain fatty acid--CoA ligase [Deltaproteobacteria bacterium]|nr:long-chain fatty acid--CoA ligase [Deltaproteobacteria bacterium]